MKFSAQILINLTREEVIEKLQNPETYKYWQKNLVSYKHLSGIPGKEGSQAKLRYKFGNREIAFIETIFKYVYPKKFHASYEAPGFLRIQQNYFEIEDKSTLWIMDSEYVFTGWMKIIGKVRPGIFKKHSFQYMKDFKTFAEEGNNDLNDTK